MSRHWRSLFMALVLAVTVFVPVAVNPPRVEAAWNGIIMPGRVLRDFGGNTSACRAAGYARVDNNVSLLVPNHCKDAWNEQPYAPAYTNGGVQIGWWGNPGTTWEDNDLTYITLDVNSVYYPTSGRNKIYRGDVAGDDYFYMTSQPTAVDGCAGYPTEPLGYPLLGAHRMWQSTMTSTTAYQARQITGYAFSNDGCLVFTKFTEHLGVCCESGAPVIDPAVDPTTLAGFSTGYNENIPAGDVDEGTKGDADINGVRYLYYNTFFEGLEDLDAYFDTHSTMTGAKLCITSSC